ncbi:MAG: hypothetical protein U0768_13735 [Anaerolineae bacterium]
MPRRDAPWRVSGTAWRVSTSVVIVLLAFAARVWNLGGPSLWLDEAMMLARAHADWWTAVVGRVKTDLAPPLYPVLLHAWTAMGIADAFVRFSSVVFGVLAVAVMSRLTTPSPPVPLSQWRERGSKTHVLFPPLPLWERGLGGEGWLAALIFAVAPTQVYHAQQANVYALVALLSALLFVAAQRAARGERWAWPALTVLAVVSAYTYYGLAFLFAGLAAWLATVALRRYLKALRPRAHPRPPAIGVGLAVVGAAVLPLLPIAAERSAGSVAAWAGSYAVLGDWAGWPIYGAGLVAEGIVGPLFPYAQVPPWLALLLTALFALGAWRRPAWAIFGWLVPMSLAYVASGFGVYPFSQRHLLFVAPAVYAVLAAGLLSLRPVPLRGLAAAALIVVLISGWPTLGLDVPWRATLPQEEMRPVLEAVAHDRLATDATYISYGATAAAAHYQELGLLPTDAYLHMGWFAGRVGVQADRALAAAGDRPRLWVIVSHAQPDEEEGLAHALTRRGAHLAERIAAPGAAALLFDLPSLPSGTDNSVSPSTSH